MYNYYPQILSIIDTLNDWNEKLDRWAGKHMDNVGVGTALLGVILLVSFWAIGALNKK